MDFLGLATLSIIDDTLKIIKRRLGEGFELEIKEIPLDDPLTLELFQLGNTIGVFQFESEGMRGHLKNLKPGNIEDIIAMNALSGRDRWITLMNSLRGSPADFKWCTPMNG
ncbi:MAG: hypothetical protein IPF46_00615 [Saprospiraceae bacterium]|nr:hypothetical protein [Candidatus Vicinibacter affinis]